MARVRKIKRAPAPGRNYFLVDANFLVNRFIPPICAPQGIERTRVEACRAWWDEIDPQLAHRRARVYVPDVCVAEAFKVLAKKYYSASPWFRSAAEFTVAKRKLSAFVRTESSTLKSLKRNIRVHDVPTSRDVIISVDRFLEVFFKNGKRVQVADLLLAASAKYLMDFYDIPKACLHIVTLDVPLREGIAKVTELPNAYDPTIKSHRAGLVFE